ncbi:MAG: DUF2752 domain-containing protein [Cyanobacteria bacterium P01_A01_bin.40]
MSAKKIQLIAIYFLCSLSILILYYFNPADYNNIYPPSLSREWGEYYCPGCGMMRALHQLLHGNWQLALRLNPLLIICLPYFFYWIVPYFLRYFYQINLYTIKFKNQQIFTISMIFTIYGFLRNVPGLWWLVPPA